MKNNTRTTETKKDVHERIAEQVMQIGSSEEAWKEWVQFRARFHQYSYYNQMSINAVRPLAKHVKGYRDWRENGRQVTYGSDQMSILYPRKKTAETEEEAEENGVEIGEEYLVTFGRSNVYAWADTVPIVDKDPADIPGQVPFVDGHPKNIPDEKMAREAPLCKQPDHSVTAKEAGTETLPTPIPEMEGDEFEELRAKAEQLAREEGFSIQTLPREGAVKGAYDPATKTIKYRETLSENQAAKTLIHELAHGLTFERLDEENVEDMNASGLEIIAEGTAHMTCAMFGLDTSEYSFPYLRSHVLGPEAIRSDEEDVQEQAEKMREAIGKHLREINRFSDKIWEGIIEREEGGGVSSDSEGDSSSDQGDSSLESSL